MATRKTTRKTTASKPAPDAAFEPTDEELDLDAAQDSPPREPLALQVTTTTELRNAATAARTRREHVVATALYAIADGLDRMPRGIVGDVTFELRDGTTIAYHPEAPDPNPVDHDDPDAPTGDVEPTLEA